MSVTRDEIARAVDPESWRYFDTGTFPPEHPAAISVVRQSREAADRVLALLERIAEAEEQDECDHPWESNGYHQDYGRIWKYGKYGGQP